MQPIHLLTLIALLAGALAGVSPAAAQTEQRCFDETGFCITGRIREFWEQHGGLPVFGYPIGPQHEALIEGRPFQVQWFERQRLELHPENARPYDVLLGRLGVDRLTSQGRDWFTFPPGTPQDGCRFFAETGHSVCGDLLAAWHANGLEFDGRTGLSDAENLALFGLPVSEPQTEIIEGRPYTVQWFERARFELHPENAPPYHVLFGLLGNEVHGPAGPPPQPRSGTIHTAAGPLGIRNIELLDRFPPGCLPGTVFSCRQALPGYHVLVVWLVRKDGGDPTDPAYIAAVKDAGDVYLTDAHGARIGWKWIGLVDSRLMVGFVTRIEQHGFTMYWPGNRPISLEQ